MTTQLEPVTVYIEPEVKEGLAAWAKKERRSLSSLAAYLLTKAYQDYQHQQNP
ncbi:MAG: ribbon-helix-helix domain-containing protein [Elainellaceae cyanobacterium]